MLQFNEMLLVCGVVLLLESCNAKLVVRGHVGTYHEE